MTQEEAEKIFNEASKEISTFFALGYDKAKFGELAKQARQKSSMTGEPMVDCLKGILQEFIITDLLEEE